MSRIECKDLVVGYNGVAVAKPLTFTVEDGDYCCIVGSNGSGKSTLLKTLLGLIKPVSGELKVNGKVGYLPQLSEANADLPVSVEEVVLSGFSGAVFKPVALDFMCQTNAFDLRNKKFSSLSGGQRQRVLLARALCACEKFLILDEPIAGLDPESMKEMYDLLESLHEAGSTIVMITHDVEVALKYATKTIEMGA